MVAGLATPQTACGINSSQPWCPNGSKLGPLPPPPRRRPQHGSAQRPVLRLLAHGPLQSNHPALLHTASTQQLSAARPAGLQAAFE